MYCVPVGTCVSSVIPCFYVFLPDICLASPVIIEFGMLAMYCMQFVMSVSVVIMYMLAMVMSLKCLLCVF